MADRPAASDQALQEARASLYRERPEDFVAARDRLVKELRGRKERDLAAEVARLRRPTISLWLANRLHEVAGERLQELLDAGGELQAAQARAAAGDAEARRRFRDLIGRHAKLVDGLVSAGLGLAAEQGYGAGEEVGRRLASTLRAASTEPGDGARALLEGTLESEMEPGGFELVSPAGGGFKPEVMSGRAGAAGQAADEVQTDRLERAARAAEARRAAVESERAAIAARTRAEELSRRADGLAREFAKARQEADAAEEEARSAEAAAAEAKQQAQDLDR